MTVLTEIFYKIWRQGERPVPWTQSLITILPKIATNSSARTAGISASLVIRKPQAKENIAGNRRTDLHSLRPL